MYAGLQLKYLLFLSAFSRNDSFIIKKYHKTLLRESRYLMQTGQVVRIGMMKLIVVFVNFAKGPRMIGS